MKPFITILFFIICILFLQCKKDGATKIGSLVGTWKLTATYGSGGGTPEWATVPSNVDLEVKFLSNGTLTGTEFPNGITYALKDSVTMSITSNDQSVENYSYSVIGTTLIMNPTGPVLCTEGCEQKLTKIGN